MQVREIMTENPACCTPDTSLQEVARMMVEHDCGCIPVVDSKSTLKPVGTVTDRDITIRAFAVTGGRNPHEMTAADVMTVGIATIRPETSVQQCCDVMEDKKIRRVLVTDEAGRLRGIVAQADVAEYGPNPTLVSRVVQEISESSPSPNRAVMRNINTGGERRQVRRSKKSFLTTRNVWPLLAGVGAGAALSYFLDSEKKSDRRTNVEQLNVKVKLSDVENTTPVRHSPPAIPFEQKIEQKTVTDSETKTATGSHSPITGTGSTTTTDNAQELGRTAGGRG